MIPGLRESRALAAALPRRPASASAFKLEGVLRQRAFQARLFKNREPRNPADDDAVLFSFFVGKQFRRHAANLRTIRPGILPDKNRILLSENPPNGFAFAFSLHSLPPLRAFTRSRSSPARALRPGTCASPNLQSKNATPPQTH